MAFRVLLVEDEGLIRLTLAEMLECAGYSVTEAVNGDDARALLNGPHGFDVLLTDIQMPGQSDGIDVARDFHLKQPNSPVVFMTGRPDTLSRVGRLTASERLLRKPFAGSQMLAMLSSLLTRLG